MTTAERIDSLLKARNMSRRQLAISADIPPSTLQSALERNRSFSFEMLQRIAKALDVTINDIVAGDWGSLAHTQSAIFNRLSSAFDQLNELGQEKAVERVEELAEIPKYRRDAETPQEDPGGPTETE